MTFMAYKEHRFTGAARETVDRANTIIHEMGQSGYILTLRQLYYRFVARGWIENSEKEYKRLGRIVTDARECGEMSWKAIEDRGRNSYGFPAEEDPESVLDGIEQGLVYDLWDRQDTYVEVWVEKQALEAVIERPCSRLRTPYMACKGYLSASEAWRAGLRFQDARDRGKDCILIHLADHDPSGLDMTRDNLARLELFSEGDVEVKRIALNMDQVRDYAPPPNPAKLTDSRAPDYVRRYGKESWELDALEPRILDSMIEGAIKEYIDFEVWQSTLREEQAARSELAKLHTNWGAVEEFLRGLE